MNFFRFILSGMACCALGASCSRILPDAGREVAAEVHDHYLYEDEIQQMIPAGLPSGDSALLVERYIREWATDLLMYEKAKQNISDMAQIDREVEEFRRTLIIHQYQQRLVEQRSVEEPLEDEVRAFYEQNAARMVASENMLKGLFLVVPGDAPRLDEVREWVGKADAESLEHIDKYTLQNAVGYDYFMDHWLPLSSITRKAPFRIKNPAKFLAGPSMVETSDSTHHYFLKISEYCAVGQPEPYDLARERIAKMLSAKKSGELVSEIERELYEDAVASQDLKIYK